MNVFLLLIMLIIGCSQKPQDKIKRIVLYVNTEALTNGSVNKPDFSDSPKIISEEKDILLAFQNRSHMRHFGPVIWKGYKWADVIYENGKSERIKASMYGAFFRSQLDGNLYQITDSSARETWQKFLSSSPPNP